MSIKNIFFVVVAASLVASSALAQTVSVDLVRNGSGIAQLDANGDWQWEVTVTSAAAGSLALEVGLSETASSVVSATRGTDFDTDNVGTPIFGTEATNAQGNAEGVQAVGNDIFAAVGSDDAAAGTYQAVVFTTAGPRTGSGAAIPARLTSSLDVTGAYGDGDDYRVAQLGANVDLSNFTESATAFGGDANLDGVVDISDVGILFPNFGQTLAGGYTVGDIDGSGTVDISDVGVIFPVFGSNAPGGAPVVVAGSAVPEPASLALISLIFASLGFVRRR